MKEPTAAPAVAFPTRPNRCAVVAALAMVLLFYGWTAASSARTFPAQMDVGGRSYFNLQTDAFLDGNVVLPVQPAPELLALEDPYDEIANEPYRVHDLVLFQGRYYLYWGPTPVVTAFLPIRLLTGGDLPERAAIVTYAFGGLLFSLALLRWLVVRYLPGTPSWMVWFGGWALATGNFVLFILRRPTVYEVSVSAGLCFLTGATYLLLSGAFRPRVSWWRLGLGGICLALAAGARPNLAVGALLGLGVLVHLARTGELRTTRERIGAATLVLAPLLVALVLLALYNKVRFGAFTEFGIAYQLNHIEDPLPPAGLRHVLPGLYFYLVAPARLVLTFPFFALPPPPPFPGTTPPRYALEPTGGLLGCAPIVIMVLGIFVQKRSNTVERISELHRIVLLMLAVAGATVLFLSAAIYGVAGRYSVDFATLVLVPALVGWFATRGRDPGWRRRLTETAGAAFIIYGSVVGIGIGFTGATDALRAGDPATYDTLEQKFSSIPTAIATIVDRPLVTEILTPSGTLGDIDYLTLGAGVDTVNLGRQPAQIEVTAPSGDYAALTGTLRRSAIGRTAPLVLVFEARGQQRRWQVSDGPIEIPLTLRRGLNWFTLRLEGAPPPEDGEWYDIPLVKIDNFGIRPAPMG